MEATVFTNSINRLRLLKNLLRSFEECNRSTDIEWVVTDYGSSDGSREWLADYASTASFPIQIILGDEKEYFARLPMKTVGRRERLEFILRKYRNDARRIAQGKLLFDIGSDHQFIRPADFVAEIQAIFSHRVQQVSRNDLSGVFTAGYFRWRLNKPINARGKLQMAGNVPYFIAVQKPYVDYMVMSRETVTKIGPYLDISQLKPDSPEMELWIKHDDTIRPETEYMQRCAKQDLRMGFLKYPFLISFSNKQAAQLVKEHANEESLIIPLWTSQEIEQKFGWLSRPVSSEELCRTLSPSFLERSLATLGKWF